MSITVLELAEYRLGHKAQTGQDFIDADLDMLGGCAICHASISAYNAYPSKSGYWKCADCISHDGFANVVEANLMIFGEAIGGDVRVPGV
jgi:hypothetical protein